MRIRTWTLAGVLTASLAGSAAAQGDPAAGKALYAPCAACHGANGEGNLALNAPAIAGQEAWYIARQLKNFKEGIRGGPNDPFGSQMAPMAKLLATDADIENVAAYVASLPPATPTDNQGGDPAAGKALYAPCAACHGADARGNKELNAPDLTLQGDWYIVRQLKNFKEGIRGGPNDPFGSQMAPMAKVLPDEKAMKDVAAYIASLRG